MTPPGPTKLKGDIAEQVVALAGLRRGWGVLRPVGDRLPYDLVFEVEGRFTRVQVRSSWREDPRGEVVDFRKGDRTKAPPSPALVDYVVAVGLLGDCYVIPVAVASTVRSRRVLKGFDAYRERWEQIGR